MKDGKKHHNFRDLTGQTFGALTALHPSHTNGKKWYWVYRCQCGQIVTRVGADVSKEVARPGTPNCGCLTAALLRAKNATHGMSKHPAYAVYRSMLDRCALPTHQAWANYGGRGITVRDRWRESFENFWADMGPTYQSGFDLERERNMEGYSPTNCKWATRRANTMNKRNTVRVIDVMEMARASGISKSTLYYRIQRGWSVEDLMRPPSFSSRCTTSSTPAPADDS